MNKLAKTTNTVDDSKKFPVVQITYLEKVVDAVVAESYGTHGSAPKDSAAILICLDNNPAKRFIIPLSALNRSKNLKEGEFETGNFVVGSIIKFDSDGNINITSQKNVEVDATKVNINCDTEITGDLVVSGDVAAATASITGLIEGGSATITGAVSGGSVAAGGKDLETHTHGSGTYQAGGDPVTGSSGSPS